MAVSKVKFQVGDITQTYADAVLLWHDHSEIINRSIGQKLSKEWNVELPFPVTFYVGEVYTVTVKGRVRNNNSNPENFVFYGTVDTGPNLFIETVRKVLEQLALLTHTHSDMRDIAIPLIDSRFGESDLEQVCAFLNSNFFPYANRDCNLELYVRDEATAKRLRDLMADNGNSGSAARSQVVNSFDDAENGQELLSRKFYLLRGFTSTDIERLEPGLSLLAEEDAGKSNPIFRSAPVGSFVFKTNSMVMEDYLVIVAFGQITENENGKIRVAWISQGFHAAIKNRNYPLQSMYEIFVDYEKRDVYELIMKDFKGLERDTSEVERFVYGGSNTMTVDMVNDIDVGEDYLAIGEDVSAFSRIVALRSFRPPLAIALCGRWGSGKSFFMEKMIQRINGLIKDDHQELFCKGVAHIRFNAWSYLDSNLWAGMVTKIFSGLNEYITKDHAGDEVKKKLRAALEEKIGLAREHALKMEEEKTQLETSLAQLKVDKEQAAKRLTLEIEKLTAQSFKDFVATVDKEFNVTNEIEKALSENKAVAEVNEYVKAYFPKELWDGSGWGLRELSKGYAFLLDFFNKKRLLANTGYLLLILLILWMLPSLLNDSTTMLKLSNLRFSQTMLSSVAILGMLVSKAVKSYKHISPIFSSLWKIRRQHSQRFEEAKANWEQKQREIEATIQKEQAELTRVEEQLGVLELELAGVEFRLANRLGSEAFAGFVYQKSNSEDYRKHQGIIATIRDDFETLSNLFDHHTTEIPTWRSDGDLERPLERIVLYIDDLDRCSEERVVEVLQAVHLIMAFRLFVVVVGIDPMRVRHALEKTLSKDNSTQEDGIAFEYLEKIFQIPFHLKRPTDQVAKEMLSKLLTSSPLKLKEVDEMLQRENQQTILEDKDETADALEVLIKPVKPVQVTEVRSIENLVLTNDEVRRAADFSELIGTSPRTLKRFANTYRVIRAHGSLVYPETEDLDVHHDVVMFLLALSMGRYNRYYPVFSSLIERPDIVRVSQHFMEAALGDVFFQEKSLLLTFMQRDDRRSLFNAKRELFAEHNKLVKRFSFTTMEQA